MSVDKWGIRTPAVAPCPACKRDLWTEAPTCIHCGWIRPATPAREALEHEGDIEAPAGRFHSINREREEAAQGVRLVVALAALIVCAVGVMILGSSSDRARTAGYGPTMQSERLTPELPDRTNGPPPTAAELQPVDRQAATAGHVASSGSSYRPENSSWDGAVREVVDWVKSTSRDPESVKFMEWGDVVQDNAGISSWRCWVKFQRKNGFGGYNAPECWRVYLSAQGEVDAAIEDACP